MKLSKNIMKRAIDYSNDNRHTITVFDKNEKWLFLINYKRAVYSDCTSNIVLYDSNDEIVGKIDVADIIEVNLHANHVAITLDKA